MEFYVIILYSGFGDGFKETINIFSSEVKGKKRVALLVQGGSGYEKFLGHYIQPLTDSGITDIRIIAPHETLKKDFVNDAIEEIRFADGIFIGGGQTEKYREIYFSSPIGEAIKAKYEEGIPIAGLSAGSILMTERFLDEESGEILSGFGFAKGISITPHFDEEFQLPRLVQEIEKLKTVGFGMENDAVLRIGKEGKIECLGTGRSWKLSIGTGKKYELEILGNGALVFG